MSDYHKPVMLSEILEFLNPQPGQTIMDCTVGGGGHSFEIVQRLLPGGKLIGIDHDQDALKAAEQRLSSYSENVILEKGNFREIEAIAQKLGLGSVDGVLMDLGVSSYQLETAERGFSFRFDAPLDMRMDRSQRTTAEELVNSLTEKHLYEVIWEYGEERWAKRIAKFIVEARSKQRIQTTSELVDIIRAAIPAGARRESIHFATLTFQALRIAVNKELESLQAGLDAGIKLLGSSRRICVLSYHSLEDRIVKDTFAKHAGRCMCPPRLPICICGAERRVSILTKRPLSATEGEIRDNPRARSAKLRVAEKV